MAAAHRGAGHAYSSRRRAASGRRQCDGRLQPDDTTRVVLVVERAKACAARLVSAMSARASRPAVANRWTIDVSRRKPATPKKQVARAPHHLPDCPYPQRPAPAQVPALWPEPCRRKGQAFRHWRREPRQNDVGRHGQQATSGLSIGGVAVHESRLRRSVGQRGGYNDTTMTIADMGKLLWRKVMPSA